MQVEKRLLIVMNGDSDVHGAGQTFRGVCAEVSKLHSKDLSKAQTGNRGPSELLEKGA